MSSFFSSLLACSQHRPSHTLSASAFMLRTMERDAGDRVLRIVVDSEPAPQITVGDVLGYLAGGTTEAEVLADFPQLARPLITPLAREARQC